MSELCSNCQQVVNILQRFVRAGRVNDKFTIPLCYYRRGWFIMDFTELYAQKKMTAAQAAALVKSGDWVDYGWAVNTPVAVDAEIAKRLPELEGVNFRGGILMWVPAIFQIDDPAAHMTWNSWHMGGIERKAIAQGFSFYSPIRYSELWQRSR